MFKELEIHEAEPELLAEPRGGAEEAAAVRAVADAQGKKDAVSTDFEAQVQDQSANARGGVFTSLRRSFLKRGSERSIPGEDATPTPAKSKSASTPVPRE